MSDPETLPATRRRSFPLAFCLALAVFCITVLTVQAAPALARTAADGPGAGEEPPAGPIVYGMQPEQGAVISAEDLEELRVGATIETQHEGGVRSAEISIDGQSMPNPSLGGAYSYLQSVSYGTEYLEPGEHTVEVTAVDSQGRAGGHKWTFTVAPADGESSAELATDPAPAPSAEEPVPEASAGELEELPDTGGFPAWTAGIVGVALLVAGYSMWVRRAS